MIVEVQWLGVAVVEALSWTDGRLSKYFRLQPHPRISEQFDVPNRDRIVPYLMTPTDGFHRLVTRELSGLSPGREATRTPYDPIALDESTSLVVKAVSMELFPGGILIARVRGKVDLGSESADVIDFSRLRSLRTSRGLAPVDLIIRKAIALAQADRDTPVKEFSYRDFFILRSELPSPPENVAEFLVEKRSEVATLLTSRPGNPNLGPRVVDAIFDENARLNEKAPDELLLCNSQGMVYLVPGMGYQSPNHGRQEKIADLALIAHYAESLLKDEVRFSHQAPAFWSFLSRIVGRWVAVPALTLNSSFANRLTWERLAEALSLRELFDSRRELLTGADADDTVLGDEWWTIGDPELQLREGGPSSPSYLGFVKDERLREFIRADHLEALNCRDGKNYRAAVVMAGAAVEGVLLAALLADRPEADHPKLLNLALGNLIEQCCPKYNERLPRGVTPPKRLISQDTAKLVDYSCRSWRNSIHPGNYVREDRAVGPQLAEASIAALNLLIDEVRRSSRP